jgi:hypothetical protein
MGRTDSPQEGSGHCRRRPDKTGSRPSRAQSEVIGVALLAGVVVIVAVTAGAIIVTQSTATDDGPTTDLYLEVSTENVTIAHNGGDSVTLTDLRVFLERDDTRKTFTPAGENATGSDGRLEPGERTRRGHGFGPGDLGVVVVHRPSNTVLLDELKPVPS